MLAHPSHVSWLEAAPPKAATAGSACRCRPSSAYPSHVSWPHGELHRKPQWKRPPAADGPLWHTPQTFRRCTGGSTEDGAQTA
eukprot:6521666-Pyramimonas_sp.AAC.1